MAGWSYHLGTARWKTQAPPTTCGYGINRQSYTANTKSLPLPLSPTLSTRLRGATQTSAGKSATPRKPTYFRDHATPCECLLLPHSHTPRKPIRRIASLLNLEVTNFCIVSDQTSEAGNRKYCYELHARSGLRFIIRLQKDVLIVPARARMGYFPKDCFWASQ
jgi:hypothetical protein